MIVYFLRVKSVFSLHILATYENKTQFFSAVHGGHMMIQKDVNTSWYPDEATIKPGSDF